MLHIIIIVPTLYSLRNYHQAAFLCILITHVSISFKCTYSSLFISTTNVLLNFTHYCFYYNALVHRYLICDKLGDLHFIYSSILRNTYILVIDSRKKELSRKTPNLLLLLNANPKHFPLAGEFFKLLKFDSR